MHDEALPVHRPVLRRLKGARDSRCHVLPSAFTLVFVCSCVFVVSKE